MFNQRTLRIQRAELFQSAQDFEEKPELIRGNLEPVDIELAAIAEGAISKSYKFYSRNMGSTLQDGDRLIDDETEEIYNVRGVQRYNHIPVHLEAVLEKVIE